MVKEPNNDLTLLFGWNPGAILRLVRGFRNFGGGGRGAKDAVHGAPHELCQRFGGSAGVKFKRTSAPVRECAEKRIEWTGAGGDYFLAVVVDREDKVVTEFWGTREAVVAWMETHWPQLRAKYVPMVYRPARRSPKSSDQPPLRSKTHRAGT
jgi:hypothetical protein